MENDQRCSICGRAAYRSHDRFIHRIADFSHNARVEKRDQTRAAQGVICDLALILAGAICLIIAGSLILERITRSDPDL